MNILDRITERTGVRPAIADVSLRLHIRELAEQFALKLIEVLRGATLPEVAEALDALEGDLANRPIGRTPFLGNERRGTRAEGLPDRGRTPIRLAHASPERASGRAAPAEFSSAGTSGARSPFDITMPGELLDAVESDTERLRVVMMRSRPRPRRVGFVNLHRLAFSRTNRDRRLLPPRLRSRQRNR